MEWDLHSNIQYICTESETLLEVETPGVVMVHNIRMLLLDSPKEEEKVLKCCHLYSFYFEDLEDAYPAMNLPSSANRRQWR